MFQIEFCVKQQIDYQDHHTTCPMKGRLLRFELNSTVTSDGDAQKLGNDVRRDSELIATKFCSQNGCKWNTMFESYVVTIIDKTSFDFQFEDFLSNLLFEIIIYCVTDQPSIAQSQRSVLNFKFSVLTFLRSMSCPMSIEQKLCQVKYLTLIYAKCDKMYWSKVCI